MFRVIQEGRAVMPGFPQLKDTEIRHLIAFIQGGERDQGTLKTGYAEIHEPRPVSGRPGWLPGHQAPVGHLECHRSFDGRSRLEGSIRRISGTREKGIVGTGAKSFGGPVATAGNLLFIAATPDEKIRAYHQKTGQILWEGKLPAAAYATPSTYVLNGKQYVVVVCGGGGKNASPHGDAVVAFALPD